MAIEMNTRTKILAGVVALAAVGAGAWFFFLDDFLNAPPPQAPAAKGAPAAAPNRADAAKPAAAAPTKADAPKPAAEAPKQADAGKAAAPAAAKPIPSNRDKLIAEVIETSGIRTRFQPFALEVVLQADTGGEASAAAGNRPVAEVAERVFESGRINDELAANLRKNPDVERMGRFLEMLRQPIALKVNSSETRGTPPDAVRESQEKLRKNPPSPARVKLLQTIDDATRTSEVALEMSSAISRSMVDTMLADLQKGGKNVPKEARQAVASQLSKMRDQARPQIRLVLYATFRNVTDEELAEFAKLMDTDTGRWGHEVLANAMRPILANRSASLGVDAGKLAMAGRGGPVAKAPKAPQPAANVMDKPADKPTDKPADKPVAAPAPVVVPGYQRPANIREVYSRHNDLISATVLRDRAAVKELLDDGKNPNARQSDGLTPLMIAASNGDAEIATLLLAKGADPNLRAGGRSALSIARARGSSGAGLVQLLERSGARN